MTTLQQVARNSNRSSWRYGQIGHGVVTVLGFVIVLAGLDEDVLQVCVVLLMDGEVGDRGFDLQSSTAVAMGPPQTWI